MKTLVSLFYLLLILSLFNCNNGDKPGEQFPESIQVTVKNTIPISREDDLIKLNVQSLKQQKPQFNPKAFVVMDGDSELASQAIDTNDDGTMDEIVTVCDFGSEMSKELVIHYANEGKVDRTYPKRTQAELSHKVGGKFVLNEEGRPVYQGGQFKNVQYLKVPPEHTDHSLFIRYEGPGWESDKVGYRFYLDWRNAIDIFGKKTHDMILQNVGQDGFDSYHEMSEWGMDILKVGDALGIGGIGMWYGDQVQRVSETDSIIFKIIANGPVQSQISTQYFGWKVGESKYDLTSDLSIHAGSRMTSHDLKIAGKPQNITTGIVKHEGVQLFRSQENNSEWAYLATYGQQSLAGDKLGMAVLFRQSDLIQVTEDEFNHVVLLKPGAGKLSYYFLAAWEQEPGGIKNEQEFKDYLENTIQKLNSPLKIDI